MKLRRKSGKGRKEKSYGETKNWLQGRLNETRMEEREKERKRKSKPISKWRCK